jgi:hypothetical protein
MESLRKHTALAALAAASLALLALASGIGGMALQPGQPFGLTLPAREGAAPGPVGSFDIRPALVAFVWVCLIVSAVGLVVSGSLRRHLLRMLPIYAVWGLLIYLFLSWLWSQAASSAGVPGPPIGQAQPTPPALPAPAPLTPPAFVANPPQWLVLAVSLAVGGLAVGAIWLVAARARRRPQSALAQIAREAGAALAGLEAGEDLRNAVLRCYAEMSRVLGERRGVQRDKTMTPREFEARLAAAGLRDEHIRRLTRLFEGVRYGPRAPGEREEREALACLRAIVAAYGTAPDGKG